MIVYNFYPIWGLMAAEPAGGLGSQSVWEGKIGKLGIAETRNLIRRLGKMWKIV